MLKRKDKDAEAYDLKANAEKQIESLKCENKALKEKLAASFEMLSGGDSVKTLQELLLVAKISAGMNSGELVFDTQTSVKKGGDISVAIINKKSKAVVATAAVRGIEKNSKDCYRFSPKAVTLNFSGATVKVPHQWVEYDWDYEVNQLITDWANAQTDKATKALDKALKSA